MSRESIIDSQFTDGFNEANALWEQDRLEECIVKAHELLAEQAIPRYHRMKTLLLLASTVGDWYEANSYRVEAEALWQIVRRWHPEGEDENIDGHMAEIRGILEDADRMLQEEEPKDYDLDDEVQHMVRNHDEEVADAQAMMQDMDLDGHKNAKAATTEMKTTDMEHSEHVPAARKWDPPRLGPSLGKMEDRRAPARQPPSDSPAMMSNNWLSKAPQSHVLRPIRSSRDLRSQRSTHNLKSQRSSRNLQGQWRDLSVPTTVPPKPPQSPGSH